MNWLALDIGGANIKVADGLGFARSCGFALWREPASLTQRLRTILAESPAADHLAITMTGELADCFASKSEGVRFILQAVADASDRRHTRVYLIDGRLVAVDVAERLAPLAAAANWHALARFAGRYAAQGPALLVDVGSTTCDVIPLVDGQPVATGKTDTQRLLTGELVYTGIERTPVCAVAQSGPYRGQECPLAAELFATMQDAYIVLGKIPEDPHDARTANGRPATRISAVARLGRMLAADAGEFDERDAVILSKSLARKQTAQLAAAIAKVVPATVMTETVILSGHGDFLALSALEEFGTKARLIRMSEQLGPGLARVGPAHALAVLAREAISR